MCITDKAAGGLLTSSSSSLLLLPLLSLLPSSIGRIFTIDNTRYFTYAGLVIATCIIFHKNWLVASLVGGVGAVYISATEYYLANNTMNGDLQPTPGTLDAIQAQFAQGMPGMGGEMPPMEDML